MNQPEAPDSSRTPDTPPGPEELSRLRDQIQTWSLELGFQQLGITNTDLSNDCQPYLESLHNGYYGKMDYMARNQQLRLHPGRLHPGTVRILSLRMDYLPESADAAQQVLDCPAQAYISRYALGRDYHKLMRKRLQQLATRISGTIGDFGYRVFVDSAPVLEKALAQKAGLGWIGKHSNLINRTAGSWFFLGEIFTDLPLPVDKPLSNHCGSCQACIDICPTQAIVAPNQVDARRCISYLTIELKEAIPPEFRPLIGNRIYGCDDCQLVCPWNRYSQISAEKDFAPRHQLDNIGLLEVFSWDETTFLSRTEGSAIRRIGYQCWMRNIAVALGNAPCSEQIIAALTNRLGRISPMVDEHIVWALEQHQKSPAEH